MSEEGKEAQHSTPLKLPLDSTPPSPILISQTPLNEAKHPVKNLLTILIIISPIFVFLILAVGAILVAYEKIPLGNKNLQNRISDIVMSIPFLPKTPKYVLTRSLKAQTAVKRFTFDLSLAANSPNLAPYLGSSNLDFSAKGPVDYSDIKNPAMAFEINSKDINVNYTLKDKFHYFKVNQLPATLDLLFAQVGISPDMKQKIMGRWYYFDGTPLDTDARRELEKNQKDSQSLTEQYIDTLFTTLKDKQFADMLDVTKEKLDQVSTYKVHFQPNDQLLDKLYKEMNSSYTKDIGFEYKISRVITNFKLDTWIDDKDYYVRKILLSYDYKSDSSPLMGGMYRASPDLSALPPAETKIPMTLSLKLSDHGKVVSITKPAEAMDVGELFKTLSQEIATQSASRGGFVDNDNSKRRSGTVLILNAVGQYMAENANTMPPEITLTPQTISTTGADLCKYLVPNFMPALPVDPTSSSKVSITNCTASYDSGYIIVKDARDRITVSAPSAEGSVISVTR